MIIPIMEQWKKKNNMKKKKIPTYLPNPQKIRVGVQQTNNVLRMAPK